MRRTWLLLAAVWLLFVLAICTWLVETRQNASSSSLSFTPALSSSDYRNATYLVEGKPVALVRGEAQEDAAPGSASHIVTRYFGNEATGDVNGDGVPDVAGILTQSGGGSGTFYYAVVALKTADGYRGTNAVLLGDRIAPQTTEIRDGTILINYADRAPGQPMSTPPSVGVSRYLRVAHGVLESAATQ